MTLRQGLKPHGFFRLSSVRGLLRNVAWPRLGTDRSGGGKARNQSPHSGMLITGRCQARSGFHAACKGMNGPQLAVGTLGSGNTRLFRGLLLGNVPTRSEAFPALFFHRAPRTLAVDWLPVPSLRKIARTVANTVVFLPAVLHGGTGKHDFVVQGTRTILLHSAQNVKCFGLPGGFFASRWAKADTRLTPGVETAGACGGLKPSPVNTLALVVTRNLRGGL